MRGHAPANRLQMSFFRAGHAHAAVLLVLSIAILAVISYAALDGFWLQLARAGVPDRGDPHARGLLPLGARPDPERPNRLIVLLWLGVVSLTAALITAGVGLIAGGIAAL